MPTLLEYFKNDFKDLSIGNDIKVQNKENLQEVFSFRMEVKHDANTSCRLFTFYIPAFVKTFDIVKSIIQDLDIFKKEINNVQTIGSFTNDIVIGNHLNCFSNRIYLYMETALTEEQLNDLNEICNQKQIYITIRGINYVNYKMQTEQPQAFISHDSRDKDLIARSIANGLNSRLCFVWYDEFSLKVGQSLRESIEKGIKEAKKCILILTPNFLSNPGWTKKEFNSIFTRELIFNERIILPVWFNVTREQVFEYSPALADTVALKWPNKSDMKEDEYKIEVEKVISKLHTEFI